MPSDLFKALRERLTWDEIDIDNWTFKLFSKVSVGIFVVAGLASIAAEYTGGAIICKGGDDFDTTYCWIHGSYHLSANKLQEALNSGDHCFRPNPDEVTDEEGRAKDTEYYIWVSLMLFIHGALFMIPDKIWNHCEGGLMKQFGSHTDSFVKDPLNEGKIYKDMSKNKTIVC